MITIDITLLTPSPLQPELFKLALGSKRKRKVRISVINNLSETHPNRR